tara:strand:+ start:503 stop:985 length:483 start_codon:yes stop_codon:yes gene_type:complete
MDGSDAALAGIAPVGGLDPAGAWHLADCILTYANGKVQRPWGSSASGYLIYAAGGHMCKSLNYPGADGRIASLSHCGTYEIVADRVRHFISVSADLHEIGTVREYALQIEHGRLTLSLSPAPAGGPGSVIDYIWHRADNAPTDNRSTPRAPAGKSFNRSP